MDAHLAYNAKVHVKGAMAATPSYLDLWGHAGIHSA